MASRPKSPLRAYSDKGREYGVSITPADLTRLAHLGRWHCLTADQLARLETDLTIWHPDYTQLPPGHLTPEYARALTGIKNRFAKLVRITNPLANPVKAYFTDQPPPLNHKNAWNVTRHGATAAGIPWEVRNTINPFNAAHAITAADAGRQIEDTDVTVLSQREITTGIDRHGDHIDAPLTSTYSTPGGRTTGKVPDLAVLHQNRHDYIAIEIERQTSRSIKLYTEKLTAYLANPAIHAIWYLCTNESTSRRVHMAAEEVFGRRYTYPLRIRTLTTYDTHYEIPLLVDDEVQDVEGRIRPNPLRIDLEAAFATPTAPHPHNGHAGHTLDARPQHAWSAR